MGPPSSGRPFRVRGAAPVNRSAGWFVSRWMRPVRPGGFGLDVEDGGSLVAVVLLNALPSAGWLECFRARGRDAPFDLTAATLRHNQLRIRLPCREDLGDLIQTVERCVEGANLDMELLARRGNRLSRASTARSRACGPRRSMAEARRSKHRFWPTRQLLTDRLDQGAFSLGGRAGQDLGSGIERESHSMSGDPYAWLPLLYVLAGGVLTLGGDISREVLRRRREARILVGRLLADLIDLRDRDRVTRLLIVQLQAAPRDQIVLRQVMDAVIPGLEALAPRYDQAVTQLAGLNPLLAVRLRGHGSFPQTFSQLRAMAIGDQTAAGAWAQIEALLDRVRGPRLEELIGELARRHGWLTAFKVRRRLAEDPVVPPEFTELLSVVSQHMPRQPQPPAAGTP